MASQYATESWEYDVTIALAVGAVWWLSEYASHASQLRLRFTADLNVVWSVLTILLGVIGIGVVFLEQFLRVRYRLSIPTTVSTLLAASLSYILLRERLYLFDREARLVQRLMRLDKLRFGARGSQNKDKYIIQWSFWKRGLDITPWPDMTSGKYPKEQVLLDWSLTHRLGLLEIEDVAKRIRAKGMRFEALLGLLIFSWLPTVSFRHVVFDGRWATRTRLRGGYSGSKGRALGLRAQDTDFVSWVTKPGASPEHFALVALEYHKATRLLIDRLPGFVRDVDTPKGAARVLIREWDLLIEKVAVEKGQPKG